MVADGRDALREALIGWGIETSPKSVLNFDLVLADGNLVLTLAKMDFGGQVLVVDTFRIERGMIRQHWDVIGPQ